MDEWRVEAEPEVDRWMLSLSTQGFAQVQRAIRLLARLGPLLGEPHSRQLSRKLRELRIQVLGRPVRITYFIAPGGPIVLLTVFEKTQRREPAELRRAERAMNAFLEELGDE